MKKLLLSLIVASTALVGCTRVDDGFIGISKSRSSGEIADQYVGQGWTQTMTQDIIQVSTRNIILNITTNPIVSEGIAMSKFEAKVNYGIVPATAPFIYKTEKNQHKITEDGDTYLLGEYVEQVAKSAISDVVRNYPAMGVNTKRDQIEREIKEALVAKLEAKGKLKYVNINEVNLIAIDPPQSIKDSVEKIVRTENEKKSMENEVEKARLEKEKNEILASSSGKQYTDLLNAQANLNFSEAAIEAAKKGQFMPMLVPHGFNGNVTVGK